MTVATDYAALLAPLSLAGRRPRNRVVHASMTTLMSAGGRVTEALITYHANRARGGAAMTVTEPIGMAHHQARLPRTQAWNDADLDGFQRWAEAVEAQDCRLIGQIQDAGRGRHYPGRNPEAIGASACCCEVRAEGRPICYLRALARLLPSARIPPPPCGVKLRRPPPQSADTGTSASTSA